MGHPNEEWLRQFFDEHRDEIELWSPSALVTKALEQFKRREWVSVEERLPEDGVYVVAWVLGLDGPYSMIQQGAVAGYWRQPLRYDTVTHWMPLEPPRDN